MVLISVPVTVSYCPSCNKRLGDNLGFKIGSPIVVCRRCGTQVLTRRREWDDRSIFGKLGFLLLWLFPGCQLIFPYHLWCIIGSIRRTRHRPGGRPRVLLRYFATPVFLAILGGITWLVIHAQRHPNPTRALNQRSAQTEALQADLEAIRNLLPPPHSVTGVTRCADLNPPVLFGEDAGSRTANWLDGQTLASGDHDYYTAPRDELTDVLEAVSPRSRVRGVTKGDGRPLRDKIDRVVNRPYLIVTRACGRKEANAWRVSVEGFIFDRRQRKLLGSFGFDVPLNDSTSWRGMALRGVQQMTPRIPTTAITP